ncbi:citrate transporter [Kosmotoga pacifica]|uniref:Citrate transporter n=2 Tax=Kosmotoga pacifica TaxID=1330330 RepID=A0A0G2ZFE6_9BACT|nr:citrate transporter [Kosmotoga pacifica]
MILAFVVFLIAYAFLATEKIHRTLVALIGAVIMVFLGIFADPSKIYSEYIDFNTIFLLIGMMTFVNVIKKSGLFEFLGLEALKFSNGNMLKLYLYFSIIVALTSAVLDNVTTILVMLPITLAVADTTGVDPVPFVLGEIFASNIGGAATLIGDPPNIMIGSAAKLHFSDFVVNLGPVLFFIFVAVNIFLVLVFRRTLTKKVESNLLAQSGSPITNKKHFYISIILLLVTIIMFIFQERLGFESSIIALFIASVSLLLMRPKEVEKTLEEVEWSTILFFVGLFIMVGALEETGFLEYLAGHILVLSRGSYQLAKALVVNISGLASAFIDNIPYTATMIPVIESMQKLNPDVFNNLEPMWWSLSLGACLGGNGTAIGASANVVGLAVLKRYYGKEISFFEFFKYGIIVLIISLIFSTLYLLLFL